MEDNFLKVEFRPRPFGGYTMIVMTPHGITRQKVSEEEAHSITRYYQKKGAVKRPLGMDY